MWCITLDRLLLVFLDIRYHIYCTERRAKIVVVSTWGFCIVAQLTSELNSRKPINIIIIFLRWKDDSNIGRPTSNIQCLTEKKINQTNFVPGLTQPSCLEKFLEALHFYPGHPPPPPPKTMLMLWTWGFVEKLIFSTNYKASWERMQNHLLQPL